MHNWDRTVGAKNHLFGWMGTILLFGIIPIKLLRFEHQASMSFLIGVAPSVLGPAGLLFLLLSNTGWISRFSLLRITLFVAMLSMALEFMQLLPRPGILAKAHYTFDYYDLAASALSIVIAYVISVGILRHSGSVNRAA
jgi:hypothetical protein